MTETTELVKLPEMNDFIQRASSTVIVDQQSYIEVGDMFIVAKQMVKEIEAGFKPAKQAADAAKKALLDWEKSVLAKVEPIVGRLSKLLLEWNLEQERLRLEEQDRKLSEAIKAEEERKLMAALEAEKLGDKGLAEEIIKEEVHVPVPTVEKAVPKVAGMTMKVRWKADVVDLKSLIRAVADGRAPMQCLQVNQSFLDAQAQACKGDPGYPGVKATKIQGMAGARR